MEKLQEIDFEKLDGLVPAVIQDSKTMQVLMLGFMNDQALSMTCETGCVVFFSRSRNRIWLKGESSGHKLNVVSISTDCDRDTLLILVEPIGPGVCHEGYESCFLRTWHDDQWKINSEKVFSPETVYGAKS
ncbi:MAG: phosphoribosyl-AMP cyclohydrolase [Actinobacteria bacterium]|nr:MAG: phosphoribosyl-AMP cyclohydrolase [Actinomycetota bacterium]